ncbi:MAG TPA: phosphoenolpyruvate carboxykinase (ATP), partial [Gemmatimonadaceae bacterium]
MHWNLVAPELIQEAVRRDEGKLADMGPFVAITSPHTGRSPNDKFIVRDPDVEKDVWWGKVN